MKLLFYLESLCSGGAERVTANLANHWVQKGLKVVVVTHAPVSTDFYRLDPSIERVALDLRGEADHAVVVLWRNFRRIAALRRELSRVKPDVAVAMMSVANVLLAFASYGLPVRAIGAERVHPPLFGFEGVRRWVACRSYGRLCAVTVQTQKSADWVKAHTSARRVSVIPNAATWPLPKHEPVIDPASLIRPRRRMLLAVGRLEEQKGFDLLIPAFASLAQQHPEWDLAILGEGSQRAALGALVRFARMEDRVFLPGRVGNVADWYGRAELYAMSSRFEGFPNTLAEALASGVPAVSFDCNTGPRDLIRPDVDGLLAPPGDTEALTAALACLMSDEAMRQRCAGRAIEARERYSMSGVAAMWENLFAEL
nr:glycosyltransferase family 4 protein [Methylocapsa acidiphila]